MLHGVKDAVHGEDGVGLVTALFEASDILYLQLPPPEQVQHCLTKRRGRDGVEKRVRRVSEPRR